MSAANRARARRLASQYLGQNDPLGWFEVLYSTANGDSRSISWADMLANPNLLSWLEREEMDTSGKKAIIIGCGLGDDAEALSQRGFDVVAFDISKTAIQWCKTRFPDSSVRYVTADLFRPPSSWTSVFDLVVEVYTLQVLPAKIRQVAIERIAHLVAPGGKIIVISRGREPQENPGRMPWPLTQRELSFFKTQGLMEISFEDFLDQEDPPVRRFRGVYKRNTVNPPQYGDILP